MSYKVTDDKLILYVNEIEVGYIEYCKDDCGITITQTYVYPGMRENGYAKNLVEYMVDSFDHQICKVNCSYYRIMSADYKLAKLDLD